jgi:DNA-binding beta-propeller fold protein YncE
LHTSGQINEGWSLLGRYGRGNETNQLNGVNSLLSPTPLSNVLYLADTENHRVLQWDRQHAQATVIAGRSGIPGSNVDQLRMPCGLAYHQPSRSLFVADRLNHRIQQFTLGKSNLGRTVVGPEKLNEPFAVQVDPSGNYLFIVDTQHHRVVLWSTKDSKGRTIAGTGVPGNSMLHLNHPTQIRLDHRFNMYVVDTENNRIQKYELLSNGC